MLTDSALVQFAMDFLSCITPCDMFLMEVNNPAAWKKNLRQKLAVHGNTKPVCTKLPHEITSWNLNFRM